jgi:signal transduction histidine kinase
VLEEKNRALDARVHELSRRDEELLRLNEELGERVKVRTAELAHALHEVETFNHSVSHDLRSPIGAILNFSAVLEEDHGDQIQAEGRRLLDRIRGAANRANHLLDSLAEYSTTEVKPGAIQLLDMTHQAERAYAEALGREPSPDNAEFQLSSLPPALGDPDLIHRVFVNLFGNALKYSRGRTPRRVAVSAETNGHEVVYRVADTGSGFDPARATDVFEAFHRLHGSEIEGSGLGLAIVAKIVRRLGGRVWAESDGSHGAEFYFTLPSEAAAI